VTWVRLGGKCIYMAWYNFSHFTIYLPKLIKIRGNLTKFWQKQKCSFLRHRVVWRPIDQCACVADRQYSTRREHIEDEDLDQDITWRVEGRCVGRVSNNAKIAAVNQRNEPTPSSGHYSHYRGGHQQNTSKRKKQFNIDLMPTARDPLTSYPVSRVSSNSAIHFPVVTNSSVVLSPPTINSDARNTWFVKRLNGKEITSMI